MILKRPKIITVEGIDGSGKTTLVDGLKDSLEEAGYTVKIFKMKGHTSDIAAFFTKERMDYENQYMKLSALMFDLMEKNWELAKGIDCDYVIFDRYTDTLDAYFGGLDVYIPWVNELKKCLYEPDLTILLDCSVEIALERLNRRKEGLKELENREYLTKVKERYLNGADAGHYVINADLRPYRIFDLALKRINDL
jgi:dTMP kinase